MGGGGHYSTDFCSQVSWGIPENHGEVGRSVPALICLESLQAVLECGPYTSAHAYCEGEGSLPDCLAFRSILYVMVALTLQSDPSGHSQLSHVPAADKLCSCDSEEHHLQIPGHASWKSFCDHSWTDGPASFHRTSDTPTAAGWSKHLSPFMGWSSQELSPHCPAGASVHSFSGICSCLRECSSHRQVCKLPQSLPGPRIPGHYLRHSYLSPHEEQAWLRGMVLREPQSCMAPQMRISSF